jgi:tetratricopeptide (TPR) repeat protein
MPFKQMKYFLTILTFLFLSIGHCCINEYKAQLDGKMTFSEERYAAPIGRFNQNNKEYLLKELHEADSVYKATGSLEDYSDLGALLVYNGEYLKAKKIFQEIESRSPGLYNTAANLGTTYELLGQNDSAYYWIQKALEINPKSHSSSEWIHLKILEAKIAANGDNSYYLTHSVLGLDFGTSDAPKIETGRDLNLLRKQIFFQLEERISFIPPKDPIVAQLLFDLGNVYAITLEVKGALEIFDRAKEYGYSSEILEKRIKYFEKLQKKADKKQQREKWIEHNAEGLFIGAIIAFLLGLVGFVLFIRWIVRRIRKSKGTHS